MTPPHDGLVDLQSATRLSRSLSAEYLEHHAVLPVRRTDGRVVVATWRESVEPGALDDLRLLFEADLEVVRTLEEDVRAAIHRVYGDQATTAEGLIEGLHTTQDNEAAGHASDEAALDDVVSQANEALVVRLVNLLLVEALEARASDVHIEQHAHGLQVRYRIDGVLQDAPSPPQTHINAVISRLKIMAELDIAERRLPQDGRIRLRLKNREVDVRVSTIPTLHGESLVLRLLDKEQGRIGLNDLGMAPDTLNAFQRVIQRPNGVVLATGPTGSGKTTTLYAALDQISTGREKILTVEDPVEYELAGVAQIPVQVRVGLTFARALRALLRQDPDVLLVGEIRDAETADVATHAALTGHLVLSTLHTNDAASALTRLLDLGVEPYLVASTVEAVLAQRLVRTICGVCCSERLTTDDEKEALPGLPDSVASGAGCPECRGTGFRGRTGIYELLRIDDSLRQELVRRPGSGRLNRIARERGLRSLKEDGIRLIREQRTTPAEVLRAVV